MIRTILYAVLLGVGMAACLTDRDTATTDGETVLEETAAAGILEDGAAAPVDASLFVIAPGRIGHVSIGMPVVEMRRQVPSGFTIADTTLQLEGQAYTAYLLRPEGTAAGLLVEQQCNTDCRVWRISVQSQDFKTTKGIGVGSKLGEVQELYQISYIGQEEGRLVAVSEEARLTFILNSDELELSKASRVTAADIPANTLVSTVLVY